MNNSPALYVGTYAKYNDGDLAGKWLKFEDYGDREEFIKAALELHKDEPDPELMFPDFENFPEAWYCESSIDDRVFEYAELEAWERMVVDAYFTIGDDLEISEILERFSGAYENWNDYVSNYVEETGMFDNVPDSISGYFDYESFGRDLKMNYTVVEGFGKDYSTFVFNSY